MISVDQIDVTLPGAAEHDSIASRLSRKTVRRSITAQVGLDLHNRSAARPVSSIANQPMA